MRALAIWSGALASLMMILVGGLTPSAIIVPGLETTPRILSLPSTWQVPSLLIAALVCGPRAAVMGSVAYLTVGLFYLPIFHGGGSLSYISTPGFGYLIGFLPSAWLTGRLAEKTNENDLAYLTLCALAGVGILHMWGSLYLIIGYLMGGWSSLLQELLFSYSIAPLSTQIILCPAVGIFSVTLRRLLFIE